MARTESFDDLVQAIQSSFLKVNKISQEQHTELLEQYFDSDNKPICIKMNYPARAETGEITYTEVEIPKLCLVPISSLKLEEITVGFKVKLSGKVRIKSAFNNPSQAETLKHREKRKDKDKEYLGYIPHASRRDDDSGYADIHLKFKSEDAPEGVMRIRDSLVRIMP